MNGRTDVFVGLGVIAIVAVFLVPPIPQDPFVYRNTLCDDIKASIRATFLGLSLDNEAEASFLNNVKSDRFVEVSSADYDVIRALKKAKEAK